MAWKGNVPKDVDFNQLLNSLNNSRLSQSNNALYQTLYQIITNVQQFRDRTVTKLVEVADNIVDIGNTIINTVAGLQTATFWTKNNETINFPASYQVIAGTGIILTYGPNDVTVSTLGSTGGILPMVNGDEPPQLMSNGVGDLIIIPYTS